jgi:hypothetical protein
MGEEDALEAVENEQRTDSGQDLGVSVALYTRGSVRHVHGGSPLGWQSE